MVAYKVYKMKTKVGCKLMKIMMMLLMLLKARTAGVQWQSN